MGPDSKVRLVTEDSAVALFRMFKSSKKFEAYADTTKDLWGRELDHMGDPDCLGSLSREEIRPSIVQHYFDGLAGRPGKQQAALAALKQFEKWAIVRDYLPRQITLGVEIESMEDGHVPWTDEQVEIGERYAAPHIARPITLAANTGQRGSDLVRMSPASLETYKGMLGINVTQKKTGKQIWVPVTSPLATAMEGWERRPGPWLRNHLDLPYQRKQLTDAWAYERDTNPKLRPLRDAGLVMHGLRGTACVRLKRAGANELQISDMVGMSPKMVERYCRFSIQKENAMAAIVYLERTILERKNDMSNKAGL